jgi:hypothetical protein
MGDNWTDGVCTSGFFQSPIEIPVTSTVNVEEGNTSESSNQSLVDLDTSLALTFRWDTSAYVYPAFSDDSQEGLMYFTLTSSEMAIT